MPTRILVAAYAVLLLAAGAGLLWAPEALGAGVAGAAEGYLFAQLYGAALLGFGAANWIVRHAPLGGIYGRAVVLGNQMFAFVSAVVLADRWPAGPGAAYWALFGVLAYGAALYGVLLFRGPARAG